MHSVLPLKLGVTVVKEEPRKKEGQKKKKAPKKDVKKVKEDVASIKTKKEKPPVTKKMTKPDVGAECSPDTN
jgi:hypothetical protein